MIPTQADEAPGRAGREHVLTVVIEDYFQVGSFSDLIPNAHWERFESRLRTGTAAFLQLLADTGNRATFFTCGWIADHHPEVLREVVAAGHEVAAQGYFQHSVQDISPAAFGADLRRSRDAVEQATGRAVRGHRIGRRWLRVRDLWVLEQIAAAGFAYDSSICPYGREFAALAECETVRRQRGWHHRARCMAMAAGRRRLFEFCTTPCKGMTRLDRTEHLRPRAESLAIRTIRTVRFGRALRRGRLAPQIG